MDEERDFIVVTDDDGNEIELDVMGYFDYEDEEYAVIYDASSDADEPELFIVKVVVDGDTEEFVAVDEDKFDTLVELVQAALEDSDCDCDDCDCDDCDCDDCDCDCGCHGDE